MSDTAFVSPYNIQQWIADKFDAQKIREELLAHGCDAETINDHIKEFRRIKNAARQTSGFICLAVGAFLGFLSCVITLINPVPELYNWFLFGLTSIAVLIICRGLYCVLE
jgi:hypothetical protein